MLPQIHCFIVGLVNEFTEFFFIQKTGLMFVKTSVRKVIGADLAINKARKFSPEDLLNMIHLELEAAIQARPEPLLSALGISYHWIEDEIADQEKALMEMGYGIRNQSAGRARRDEIDDIAF